MTAALPAYCLVIVPLYTKYLKCLSSYKLCMLNMQTFKHLKVKKCELNKIKIQKYIINIIYFSSIQKQGV